VRRLACGDIQYYVTFCIDRVGLGNLYDNVSSGTETNAFTVPMYPGAINAVPLPVKVTEKHGKNVLSSLLVCFNCGAADHTAVRCKQAKDENVIRANNTLYRELGGQAKDKRGRFERYCESGKEKPPENGENAKIRVINDSSTENKSKRWLRVVPPVSVPGIGNGHNNPHNYHSSSPSSSHSYSHNPGYGVGYGAMMYSYSHQSPVYTGFYPPPYPPHPPPLHPPPHFYPPQHHSPSPRRSDPVRR